MRGAANFVDLGAGVPLTQTQGTAHHRRAAAAAGEVGGRGRLGGLRLGLASAAWQQGRTVHGLDRVERVLVKGVALVGLVRQELSDGRSNGGHRVLLRRRAQLPLLPRHTTEKQCRRSAESPAK